MSAALAVTLSPLSSWSQEPYADPKAAEVWMNTWMKALGAVNSVLHLGRFADPIYFLRQRIEWSPNLGQGRLPKVVAPIGLVTDFATIPRIFWSALPPDGIYTYAAIIHDYLYWTQNVSRAEADLVFKHAMEDFKINAAIVTAIYAAVRVGGGSAWDGNAMRRRDGEQRIIKRFPEDPTITWAQWKVRPGVF